MPTFLHSWLLVFNVDATHASLNEHFSQLHHTSDATESSISICYDWDEVVDLCSLLLLLFAQYCSLIILFPIVEELGFHELHDFVWHGVHGVVSEVWSWFVSHGHVSGGALPS
jgi:hypothetical protein